MLEKYMFASNVLGFKYNGTVIASNRYDTKATLITNDGEYTRTLKYEELYAAPSDTDLYIAVDITNQYDPFKISYQYYGTVNYYWVILSANNLFSMFDLVEGLTIRIPNISKILGSNGLLVQGDEI
jgi:hypothetical protein